MFERNAINYLRQWAEKGAGRVGRARGDGVRADTLHEYTLELFRKYMIVGGLPEAVANYAEHHDLVRLNRVFNALIAGYRDDVEKYADKQRDHRMPYAIF